MDLPKRWLEIWILALLLLTSVLRLATAEAQAPVARGGLSLLVCDAVSPRTIALKLILLNPGRQFDTDGQARLEFGRPDAPGHPFESPAPGPRTVNLPVKCSEWAPDHVEVLSFGPFSLSEGVPTNLEVRGGLVGDAPTLLGTLTAGDRDSSLQFRRAFPAILPATKTHRVIVTAVCERTDARRFVVKLAYLNCGERFETALSAFLHFELAPKGEDLDPAIALRLLPSSRRVNTSTWRPDELTVVQFGPFEIPRDAPEHVYLRAGLYDQFGTPERLDLAGSDDGTGRVLVGTFTHTPAGVLFQRNVVLPAG